MGEAPGKDEVLKREPFVGAAGNLVTSLCVNANIDRASCFVGNVCQFRPPGNKFKLFVANPKLYEKRYPVEMWGNSEVIDGYERLRNDIARFDPTLCILLGDTALRATGIRYAISDFRGYVFRPDHIMSPFYGRKCIATYHPAYIFRVQSDAAIAKFDFQKARVEASNLEIYIPPRNLIVEPSFDWLINEMRLIRQSGCPISIDIEGWVYAVKCCSISKSPTESFIVPFMNMDGSPCWTLEQEVLLVREFALLMSSPCPKILQSGLYDRFVLWYNMRIVVANQREDSMIKFWELFCEMEKSLQFMASILTREPYWKSDLKSDSKKSFFTYCCKDSAVTHEIVNNLEPKLVGQSRFHYQFNIKMLNPILYVEQNGMILDLPKRDNRIAELRGVVETKQTRLNLAVGHELNVNSPPQVQDFLYKELKLPEVRKDAEYEGEEGSLTGDFATILEHYRQTKNSVLWQIIELRRIRKRLSGIVALRPDDDGKIRSTINVVGTETGRLSNKKSPTGRGANLQTIPDEDRDLFIAPDGCEFFQCDLAGADGWTVAAHCAALGDTTMMEDLLYGLKIPKLIALMNKYGGRINSLPRSELKKMSDEVSKKDHMYISGKQVQHGSAYGMKPHKVAQRVFLESDGEIFIEDSTAKILQNLFFLRYQGVKRWHEQAAFLLRKFGYLISASGQKRLFFGRKDNQDTVREYLAHEPQANTTYVTNRALLALWEDKDNRILPNNALRIQPCHQVHDALCGTFRKSDTAWAAPRIKSYFAAPVQIANQQVQIPYEGGYGPNWFVAGEPKEYKPL